VKRLVFLVITAVALCVALAAPSVLAQPNVVGRDSLAQQKNLPKVVDRDSLAFGRGYAELSAAFWQWSLSIPVANHPLFDNGDCSVGQSGDVWFLGPKFCIGGSSSCNQGSITHSCSIPRGKAIFFPIIGAEDSAPEEPAFGCGSSLAPLIVGTTDELAQCAQFYSSYGVISVSAEIDGIAVPNLMERFHVTSPVFGYTMPDDNVLSVIGEGPYPAGTYFPAVADGVYVLLPPLSPGHHVIKLSANPFYSATYTLKVAK
jgi:hypothetical protein